MESESKYEDLITRYLLNEANPKEEAFVVDWIKADEKNGIYVEKLKRTLQLFAIKKGTDHIDINQEWEQFKNEFLGKQQVTDQNGNADGDNSNGRKRKARIFSIAVASAVAASIITVIAVNSGWFANDVHPGNTTPQITKTPENSNKIDPLMAVVQHEVNTSGKIKKFMTPDGSEIALFDSSEITYKEPADGKRRDVYLVGKADFKVAKNKAKPFTVFSEEISTTAVGTMFTVTAKQNDKSIRVKLDEGKVVVKSLKGYNYKWTKDYYMSPGQELVYDKSKKTITVTSGKTSINKSGVATKDNPAIPNYDKRSWFMFNNQRLDEIFDALSAMYDVKIEYSKKDVKSMYFIGTYDKSDSLSTILNQIAVLNKLEINKTNSGYKVQKKIIKK